MKVLLETGFIIATAKIIYAVNVFLDKESGKNKKIKKSLIDILLSFVIELCEFILLKTLNVEAQDVILKTVIICSVLQIILIYVLAFIKKRKKSPRFNIMNLFIVIFPLSQLMVVPYCYVGENYNNLAISAVTTVIGCLIDSVLLYIVYSLWAKDELDYNIENQRKELELMKLNKENIEQDEKKLHELKNKYNEELKQILVMYTDNEDGDKIASSIEVLEAKVRSTGEKRFCKNMIVNAVLEDKDRIIKQNGIKAEYSVKAGENTNISNLHLCSIFSNILNNAINACLEIEDKSKRFISVKCDYSGDYMNVLVKNSADKNQKKKIRSSEHGWGMKILEDIAQQYNGRLEYGFKDGIYSTMVSLVYTNNQEESI